MCAVSARVEKFNDYVLMIYFSLGYYGKLPTSERRRRRRRRDVQIDKRQYCFDTDAIRFRRGSPPGKSIENVHVSGGSRNR